jgi:hypothetical protein
MKTRILFIALLASAALCFAAEKKATPGPKGGKLLENSAPRAEFFIDQANHAVVTFYDAQLKPVAAAGQVVAVIAEPPSGKVTLTMEPKEGGFVSKEALPKDDGYTIVVQVKVSADAKPQNFRTKFDLGICGECKHAEYACICGH